MAGFCSYMFTYTVIVGTTQTFARVVHVTFWRGTLPIRVIYCNTRARAHTHTHTHTHTHGRTDWRLVQSAVFLRKLNNIQRARSYRCSVQPHKTQLYGTRQAY